MRRHLSLALSLVLAAATFGEEPAAKAAKAAATAESPVVLAKGMQSSEVRTAIGAPLEIKPFGDPKLKAEVWIYRRLAKKETVQEATGTWNRPYFDPVANTMKHAPEPVYSNATVSTEEVTHLLFVGGLLVEWKRFSEQSKKYE